MQKYYFHPVHGYHIGDPIGGTESTEITEEEFELQNIEWQDNYKERKYSGLDSEVIFSMKKDELRLEKIRIRDGGFKCRNLVFDSDNIARTSYAELAITFLTDPTFSISFKASEGHWLLLDSEVFLDLKDALREHLTNCYTWVEITDMQLNAIRDNVSLTEEQKREALISISTKYPVLLHQE